MQSDRYVMQEREERGEARGITLGEERGEARGIRLEKRVG